MPLPNFKKGTVTNPQAANWKGKKNVERIYIEQLTEKAGLLLKHY